MATKKTPKKPAAKAAPPKKPAAKSARRKPKDAAPPEPKRPPRARVMANAILTAPGVPDPLPNGRLNATQERFVHEYLKDRNGTQAYLRIFPKVDPASARTAAWRLLTNADVRRVLEEERVKTIRALSMDRERLIGELVAIATADPNELIQYRRCACPDCWPQDADPKPGIYDPPSPDCLTCNGEGVGRELIADTRFLSPQARALYAGVKITRDGMQVLMRDQDGAIDRLARVLGVFKEDNTQKNQPVADAVRDFFGQLHGTRLPIKKDAPQQRSQAGPGHPLVGAK